MTTRHTTDQRTQLLLRLSQWHPGREADALEHAIKYSHAHAHAREPIRDVLAFVDAWPDEQLAKIPVPSPRIPLCGNCEDGWIVDPDTNKPTHKCDCRTARPADASCAGAAAGEPMDDGARA